MRILLIGATGTIGTAVHEALTTRGHDVLAASRSSSEWPVDIDEPKTITSVFEKAGPLDGVACAAGSVPYGPWESMDHDQWMTGINSKLLGQVELTRQAVTSLPAGGSVTLITGVLAREPVRTASVAAAVGGALESWVVTTAAELFGRIRINAISPTVLSESAERYQDIFPGFPSVPAVEVAQAYVRSIEGLDTGRIYQV